MNRDKNRPVNASDRMGTAPVGKLLFSMATPMIISMLVQALYNIVDSVYVAEISENALTAVSLAFPMQMLMIAVSTGTGVGINAALSRSLGEGNRDYAGRVARNGLFLIAIAVAVFTAVGLFGSGLFMRCQTDIGEIVEGGTAYLTICMGLCVFLFFQVTFEKLLQSTGRTMFTMISQGTGAILNIIFDPILIRGMWFFPEMGIAGAAAATVFGQAVGCTLGLIFNLTANRELNLSFRRFKPEWQVIRTILTVGVPSILMQAIGSVMSFGMNQILLSFVSTAAAVFGVYFKLQSIIFMPVFGLNNGMVPIIAYNYGAKNLERMRKTTKLAAISATVLMLIGLAVMQAVPDKLLLLFKADENMLGIGVSALRIISMSFVFAGFGIVISSVFQALGNGMYSLILSFIRQVVVLLPVAWLMSLTGRLELVWLSFPIAEVACMLCCLFLLVRVNRRVLNPVGQREG